MFRRIYNWFKSKFDGSCPRCGSYTSSYWNEDAHFFERIDACDDIYHVLVIDYLEDLYENSFVCEEE